MPIGYNVLQPSGTVKELRVQDAEERDAVVAELCERWRPYCTARWLSDNHEDPWCPENKIKRFLDGVAYFLMVGDTKRPGVISDYKRMADGNREIPLSSCPSFVEERLYGGGAAQPSEEELATLQRLQERLDEKVPPSRARLARQPVQTRYDRIKAYKLYHKPVRFEYPVVDTEGFFTLCGQTYYVDEGCEGFAPKETKLGLLYDEDHVTAAFLQDGSVDFFDKSFFPINEYVRRC